MGDLGLNVPSILFFGINFILLLIILRVVAYKPLLDKLDERARMAQETVDQYDKMKQDTASAEDTVKAQIEAGRKEAQAIINQAADIGERLKAEARDEARKEAEVLIARARAEIDKERLESMEQLRREFVDLTILAAQRVISESIDKKKHRELIEQMLDEGMKRGNN